MGTHADDGYEFSLSEDVIIGKVGKRSRAYGIVSLITGALMVAGGFIVAAAFPGTLRALGIGFLVAGFVPLISGRFYLEAGAALSSVVTTQGEDIPHMMEALGKLRGAVRIEGISVLLGFIVGLVVGTAIAAQ